VRGGRRSPKKLAGRGSLVVGREKSRVKEREREIYNTVHRKGSFRRGCENDTM
jgi:hypothetical protein